MVMVAYGMCMMVVVMMRLVGHRIHVRKWV